MLREEWRTKGQQSFTIRFRRDKLTVIFSRIRSSQPWVWTRSGQDSGCTSIHPGRPSWLLDMLASVSRNSLPRPASRHCRSIRFQTQEGSVCSSSLPPSADALTSALPNLSLHSQFGPLRMGMHCGKKGGGCLTAGPVANMNLTRLNSNSGLYEHTRLPTKADLTVQNAGGSLDTTAHWCFTQS